ncbi:MAG: GNAT family N-acetyltransferase, partial [Clostridia bacterium]|nr:GNAT family N-acetyltransferase [Clostridia bacterium]
MHIRKTEKKDIPALLQMIRDSYTPYREQIRKEDIPSYNYDDIASLLDNPGSDVWLAEENGRIAGMAAGTELGPCAYHLKMLFVAGDSQHKGVGRTLLEQFEKRGTELHHSLFTANYLDWAEWSRTFYGKHGYREYVPADEEKHPGLKAQADFLRSIGRLNNGEKHLLWKIRQTQNTAAL